MNAQSGGGWSNWLALMLAGAGGCFAVRADVVLQTIYATAPARSTVPFSGIVQAPDGNFYGTRPSGAGGTYGSVFRVTPAGTMTTLVQFLGSNGNDPEGSLVLATNGGLYGTTALGGAYSAGTLFKITTTGSFQRLHSFNGSDGAYPAFNLIQASDGFLYGVTMRIVSNTATIFRADLAGTVTPLTNLSAAMPGYAVAPTDGLVEGPDGWLYGTTRIDSPSSKVGSIYRISTNGLFQTVVYFTAGATGVRPAGGLTSGRDGFLYGTLTGGNSFSGYTNGQVFRMTTNGVLTTLVAFAVTNGTNPRTRMLLASDGHFYGQTDDGGPSGMGTIFRVTTDGLLTTLAGGFGYSGGDNGAPPLTQASDGNLYGTGMIWGGYSSALVVRLVQPPLISRTVWSGGRITLTWNSFSNGVYRLAYKSAVNSASWTTQATTITATSATTSASDYPGTATQRYYQVVLLP
jgi:uncharacterized repeat protein (TIGR03803 family)